MKVSKQVFFNRAGLPLTSLARVGTKVWGVKN